MMQLCIILRVLNALRHQWNAHSSGAWARALIPSVLNALRHQWNAHPITAGGLMAMAECSTPCGINGMLTPTAQ